ncbi:MAG: type II toxin-antitoxin system VapC family toxin [Anaerolineae bacterium]|nr:type II toxin-antitoxin system VapC family toxin [Anaerolineae bacterium]
MPNSSVCVDASFLLRMLLDEAVGPRADGLWEAWHREGRRLVAPTLLDYEVVNALHRYVAHRDLSSADAEALLDLVLRLDVERVGDGWLHPAGPATGPGLFPPGGLRCPLSGAGGAAGR